MIKKSKRGLTPFALFLDGFGCWLCYFVLLGDGQGGAVGQGDGIGLGLEDVGARYQE